MQTARRAGLKGGRRNYQLYKGMQQVRSGAKAGLVTSLRVGPERRSEMSKVFYKDMTKAQRRAHTEPARIALAKKRAKNKAAENKKKNAE
jgi:hypothetical protein